MAFVFVVGLVLLLQPSQGPFSAPPLRLNITNTTSPSRGGGGGGFFNQTIVPDKATLPAGDATSTGGDATTAAAASSTPSPISADPFRPSIAVLIAILTTFLSLSVMVFLFAKNCRRRRGASQYGGSSDRFYGGPPPLSFHLDQYYDTYFYHEGGADGRTDSGLDRSVVDGLPVFPFFALNGRKQGLECAVCLSKYEASDILRLLPACNHAFHLDCVDLWLLRHSTCPLCRCRVTSGAAPSFCRRRLDAFLSSTSVMAPPSLSAATESGSWRFAPPSSLDIDSIDTSAVAIPGNAVANDGSRRFFPTLLDIMRADSASRRFFSDAAAAGQVSSRTFSGISTAGAAALHDRGPRLEFYVQTEGGDDGSMAPQVEGGVGAPLFCPCGGSWRSNHETPKMPPPDMMCASSSSVHAIGAGSKRFASSVKTSSTADEGAATGSAVAALHRGCDRRQKWRSFWPIIGHSQRMTRSGATEEAQMNDPWGAAPAAAAAMDAAEQRRLALMAAQRRRRGGAVGGSWRYGNGGGDGYCYYYGEEVLRRLNHRINIVAVADDDAGGGGVGSSPPRKEAEPAAYAVDAGGTAGCGRRCMSEIGGLQRRVQLEDVENAAADADVGGCPADKAATGEGNVADDVSRSGV